MNYEGMSDILSIYTSYYRSFIEDSYEYYMSLIETILSYWGKNRDIVSKRQNIQVDMFNAYLMGYEKAKKDLTSFSSGAVISAAADKSSLSNLYA